MGIKAFGNNAEDFVSKFLRATSFDSTGLDASSLQPVPTNGIVATGGYINDYEDSDNPGVYWRSHLFTSSGTFEVDSLGDTPTFGPENSTIQYVVVAGGGGGGGYVGDPSWSGYKYGYGGSSSEFDVGGPNPISTVGGGGGAVYPGSPGPGEDGPMNGGSGGGGVALAPGTSDPGGTGTANQGHAGGIGYFNSPNKWRAGGGGGAGGGGYSGGPSASAGTLGGNYGKGGEGLYTKIFGESSIGLAGGGSAGGRHDVEGFGFEVDGPSGPYGGGGGGAYISGRDGVRNTGGGAGGGDIGGAGAGGGGAGGYRSSVPGENSGSNSSAESVFTVAAGINYTVTIGAGGFGSRYQYPGPEAAVSEPSGGGGRGGSGVVGIRYRINSLGEIKTFKASGGQVYQWIAPASSPIANGSESVTVHVFTSTGKFVTPGSFSETCEYVVIGGGGGGGRGGSAEGSGGGGSGGYITGTVPIGGGQNISVTVGSGGRGGVYPSTNATSGGPSSFGPTLIGCGVGKGSEGTGGPGSEVYNGGSGGGGGHVSTTGGLGNNQVSPSVAPVSAPAPLQPQGYPGGNYVSYSGGGGGGAGGAGSNATSPGPSSIGGDGGVGVQLPATFQAPNAVPYAMGYPGPGGGSFWFAGGGGGAASYTVAPTQSGGRGGGPGGPYAGAGNGGRSGTSPLYSAKGTDARMFSGSGGGGNGYHVDGFIGGSGTVIIAYLT